MQSRIYLAAVILLAAATAAAAGVPQLVSYQGRAANPDGTPINGVKPATFAFYDAPAGGEPIGGFSETLNVSVADGVYNAVLGSATPGGLPAGIFQSTGVYLGVTIDGQQQAPRQQMTLAALAPQTAEAKPAATESASQPASDDFSWCWITDLVGRVQGRIEGDDTIPSTGLHGCIYVCKFDHTIDMRINPVSGAPGEISHHVVKIVKNVDKVTVPLYKALATRERFDTVIIRLYTQEGAGLFVKYFTIKLDDAYISSIRKDDAREEVCFTYGRIWWTDEKQDYTVAGEWRP